MGAALKNTVISATGELGVSYDQIKKWVNANGGQWSPKVMKGVTHLISSKEHYKKKVDSVNTAEEIGARIVSYDWLEDSLQKKRKLAEKKYEWKKLGHDRRIRKGIKRMAPNADSTSDQAPTPRKSSGGFFTTSLGELRKAREKREAAARAKLDARAAENNTAEQAAVKAGKKAETLESMDVDQEKDQTELPSQTEVMDSTNVFNTPTSDDDQNPKCPSQSQPLAPASLPPPSIPLSQRLVQIPPKSKSQSKTIIKPLALQGPPSSASPPDPKAPRTERLTDNYHIFLDETGFEYNISLLRKNLRHNKFARYNIRLFESNTKPHVYCTFIRYVPLGAPDWPSQSIPLTPSSLFNPPALSTTNPILPLNPAMQSAISYLTPSPPTSTTPFRTLLAPPNSPFAPAFAAFTSAFTDLTFVPWHLRLHPSIRLTQQHLAARYNREPFVYTRPQPGLPVGRLPDAFFPAEQLDGPGNEVWDTQGQTWVRRNVFELPGMGEGLGDGGAVGSVVLRERRRVEEEERQRMEVLKKEEEEKKKRKQEEMGLWGKGVGPGKDPVRNRAGEEGGGRAKVKTEPKEDGKGGSGRKGMTVEMEAYMKAKMKKGSGVMFKGY